MENCGAVRFIFCAICIAFNSSFAAPVAAAIERGTLLTGKAAMGDWTSDGPGVRRKITVQDLPAPSSNGLAINLPRVIPNGSSLEHETTEVTAGFGPLSVAPLGWEERE